MFNHRYYLWFNSAVRSCRHSFNLLCSCICSPAVLLFYIMSHKPEPIPFQGYSGDDHIPVDQEDAAAMKLHDNAHAGSLDHRSTENKEGIGFDRSRSAGTTVMSDRVTEPSMETTRSGIEGCTANKPLSSPEFGHDSESVVVEEPEGPAQHNDTGHLATPSDGNGVRRSSRATTTRSTAGRASQACDNSDQPPISSSENAEEQGYAERNGTRKSKISSGRKASKRRKK